MTAARLLPVLFGLALASPAAATVGSEASPGAEAARRSGAGPLSGVGVEPRLGAALPLDLELRDERGAAVRLGDLFGGKPVILNLGYYECPMLCSLVTEGLLRALRTLSLELDRDYRILTVSIDPGEGAELAAAKKRRVLARLDGSGGEAGWRFLTGDAGAVRRLAEAVGFEYAYDEATGQYAHAAAVAIATPEGRIARYFYGVDYADRDLRLGLVEASAERIGTLTDRVLLFCYQYDPATGRYSTATLALVRLGGVATVLGIGGFILVATRRERRGLGR